VELSSLRKVIKDKGLMYKEVAKLTGYNTTNVCHHTSLMNLPAEAAIRYARALKVDPAEFRPDLLKRGEVNFIAERVR
jgi:hypothetical protein